MYNLISPKHSLPGGSLATDARRATPEGGNNVEYSELVEYYRRRLQERYRQCTEQPERRKALELIHRADEETLRKVIDLLEQITGYGRIP